MPFFRWGKGFMKDFQRKIVNSKRRMESFHGRQDWFGLRAFYEAHNEYLRVDSS